MRPKSHLVAWHAATVFTLRISDPFPKNLGIGPVHRYGPSLFSERKGSSMAERIVPHFHNDAGVAVIEIGAREFMCVGALPPFDHPHIFCDMGDDNEFICPYCRI